jgi:hypothetical protein
MLHSSISRVIIVPLLALSWSSYLFRIAFWSKVTKVLGTWCFCNVLLCGEIKVFGDLEMVTLFCADLYDSLISCFISLRCKVHITLICSSPLNIFEITIPIMPRAARLSCCPSHCFYEHRKRRLAQIKLSKVGHGKQSLHSAVQSTIPELLSSGKDTYAHTF